MPNGMRPEIPQPEQPCRPTVFVTDSDKQEPRSLTVKLKRTCQCRKRVKELVTVGRVDHRKSFAESPDGLPDFDPEGLINRLGANQVLGCSMPVIDDARVAHEVTQQSWGTGTLLPDIARNRVLCRPSTLLYIYDAR